MSYQQPPYLQLRMLRPIPSDFVFPVGSVNHICDIFFHGIPGVQIQPFRLTQSRLFKRHQQANYCKGMLVFNVICQAAVDFELVPNHTAWYSMATQEWDVIFTKCYSYLIVELETVSGKVMLNAGVKSYATVCDWILRYLFESN